MDSGIPKRRCEERYQVSHCVPEQGEMTETYEALGKSTLSSSGRQRATDERGHI